MPHRHDGSRAGPLSARICAGSRFEASQTLWASRRPGLAGGLEACGTVGLHDEASKEATHWSGRLPGLSDFEGRAQGRTGGAPREHRERAWLWFRARGQRLPPARLGRRLHQQRVESGPRLGGGTRLRCSLSGPRPDSSSASRASCSQWASRLFALEALKFQGKALEATRRAKSRKGSHRHGTGAQGSS